MLGWQKRHFVVSFLAVVNRSFRSSTHQRLLAFWPRIPVGRRFLRFIGFAIAALLLIVAGFRAAAWLREGDDRAALAPASGRLVATGSGSIFLQDAGPAQ